MFFFFSLSVSFVCVSINKIVAMSPQICMHRSGRRCCRREEDHTIQIFCVFYYCYFVDKTHCAKSLFSADVICATYLGAADIHGELFETAALKRSCLYPSVRTRFWSLSDFLLSQKTTKLPEGKAKFKRVGCNK